MLFLRTNNADSTLTLINIQANTEDTSTEGI